MIDAPHIELPIIGYIRSPLTQKFGIPRQPNLVDIRCRLEFIAPYDTAQAFEGLAAFSHLWVIWQFHHNQPASCNQFRAQVRPPRLGGNDKIGVFATRSMYRPANLGLSVVKLIAIEQQQGKVSLVLAGADMVDGTPVLDIKPYLAYSDRILEAHSGYAHEKPTLKRVYLTQEAQQQQAKLIEQQRLTLQDMTIIQQLIAQDPRPAYRQTEVNSRFTMRYQPVDVSFAMDETDDLVIQSIDWVGPSAQDSPHKRVY